VCTQLDSLKTKVAETSSKGFSFLKSFVSVAADRVSALASEAMQAVAGDEQTQGPQRTAGPPLPARQQQQQSYQPQQSYQQQQERDLLQMPREEQDLLQGMVCFESLEVVKLDLLCSFSDMLKCALRCILCAGSPSLSLSPAALRLKWLVGFSYGSRVSI